MTYMLFDKKDIRFEISFKTYDELHRLLSFFQEYNISKINIPCKGNLKKEFLLNSIKMSRIQFPNIDIIPHFSILHEFRRNSFNTQRYFIEFLNTVKYFGCSEVLLISGSQKRSTLDTVKALNALKDNSLFLTGDFSMGVAFNPYLSSFRFEEEINRLEKKIQSGLVTSIWIQFGTDIALFESRIKILKELISSTLGSNSNQLDIKFFGSILIPSRQFLARFKYRPWKGVYCSQEFLDSIEVANNVVRKLFETYKIHKILPIIETNVSTEVQLNSLETYFTQKM